MRKVALFLALVLVGSLAWLAALRTPDGPALNPPLRNPAPLPTTEAPVRLPPQASPPALPAATASISTTSEAKTVMVEVPAPPEIASGDSVYAPGPYTTAHPSAPAPTVPVTSAQPFTSAGSGSHATTGSPAGPASSPPPGSPADPGTTRLLMLPVAGFDSRSLHDMFNEMRGNRRHEAIDLLAPRGTPVVATDDGVIMKLFTSVPGGLTIYEFDPDGRYCYYYAHLDAYAAGVHEGQQLHQGDVIGYVGTSGNAPKDTPHLHFAVIRLGPEKQWWKGTYVNPYPLLIRARKGP